MNTPYPDLVPDTLEWDDLAFGKTWAIIVEVDASQLPGLPAARKALRDLNVVMHPDHYLHCTLRELGVAGEADDESLDAIGEVIAATPGWQAEVRGIKAFPTAIWADPDADDQFASLMDKLLAEIGTLSEHPYRARALGHLTIAYSRGFTPSGEVREALEPVADIEIGTIDVKEAVLAELHFTEPYPSWGILRRFPFAHTL